MKREGYLDWDTTFMALAHLVAKRSKDPHTQVGAVIVDPNNIVVGLGYNGFPRGLSDDLWCWQRPQKYLAVVHAEANAILNSNQRSLENCRLYVPFFTCSDCAKLIIQSGIKEVIYCTLKYFDSKKMGTARKLYDLVGVKYRQFTPLGSITLDFG